MLDTVVADQTHRAHAIIVQDHADLKNSSKPHKPIEVFTANAAWMVLTVIVFNLNRALDGNLASPDLARATTATLRRKLVHLTCQIATSTDA